MAGDMAVTRGRVEAAVRRSHSESVGVTIRGASERRGVGASDVSQPSSGCTADPSRS